MLFADDAAVAAYSSSYFQSLMDHVAKAYTVFEQTISLKKKTDFLAQATTSLNLTIYNYKLEVIESSNT